MKDHHIHKLIQTEEVRQAGVINLIASENYVSDDVLAALGSGLTNKYAEGYPGKRYYGGNEVVDQIEQLCQERALEVFDLSPKKWAVNVQALSGSPANFAVYTALLKPGDKIMGLSLSHGGHLTHGHKVSASGIYFTQIAYEVDKKTEQLDYEALKRQAQKEKPQLIVAGFSAYSRVINWKKFRDIADACGALLLVDMSHIAGLVAGKQYASPFRYADVVTTTTHKTLRGPRAALIFSRIDNRSLPTRIDKAVFPGLQGGPHINQIAATAVALKEAASPRFARYAEQTIKNAKACAKELQRLGWRIVSGGTDSHVFLVDVSERGLTGTEASNALEQAGIIVNKNTIPFDTRSPMDPSGIRIGSPAETTRGKKERDFISIAQRIDSVLTKQISS
jgi:glycine hydroxymethyltransferase